MAVPHMNGLPVGGDMLPYNLSTMETCATSQPSLLIDGSGWHEQQVFYATERDYCAKKKSYGMQQMQQLRYGSALVRIPKLREPGQEAAYRIPFAVRRKKHIQKNGRYFITLYDHHTGRPLKLEDFEAQVKDKAIQRGKADSHRNITSHVPDVFRCCCGVPNQEGRCREPHEPSEARLRFLAEVKAAVRASARRELVVFVHGYNVNFEACIKSAAQLTFDTAQDYSLIDLPGRFEYKAQQRVAVAFDWASHSRLMAYGFVPCVQDDRERAAEAGPKLAHLLLDLAAKMKELELEGAPCNGIHLVAHSMGNYVTHYAIEHLGNKPDCADNPNTAAAAAAAAAARRAPDMVTELSLSPTSSAAAGGCYTSPELLPPLATVREESGSLSSSMKEAASAADAAAPPAIPEEPDAADTSAGNQACISQFDDSAGELQPCSDRPHSFIASPFAHPHHNCSSLLHTPAASPPPPSPAAAAGSSSSSSSSNVPNAPKAGVLLVPHQQFRSFAVAESEPSDGAKRLALYDSSQVVLVHTQCLMRSREAQHLMQLTKTIILAAADVSRHDLVKTVRQVKVGAAMHGTAMPHITLYCSRRDQALAVSSVLRLLGLKRTDGRAGFFLRKPRWCEGHLFHPFLFNNVTSVDCTGFSADWLGHGYFREHRQVLTDMSQAFAGITSTKLRTAIKAAKDGEHWKCMACNDVVIQNKNIELYTVMSVEEQHAQQLQQLRRQMLAQRETLQQLAGCESLAQWQARQVAVAAMQQLVSPSQRMPL